MNPAEPSSPNPNKRRRLGFLMPAPVLAVIAGPNGSGKSTFRERVLAPSTQEFVNADEIAAEHWPGAEAEHAYDAARLAEQRREELLRDRTSFVTETVFSHESKVALVRSASQAGYVVVLRIIIVPVDLAVARVEDRVANGGHTVPEDKIRSRHERLWGYVVEAIGIASEAHVYDNTSAKKPFKPVALYRNGTLARQPRWPTWATTELASR